MIDRASKITKQKEARGTESSWKKAVTGRREDRWKSIHANGSRTALNIESSHETSSMRKCKFATDRYKELKVLGREWKLRSTGQVCENKTREFM